MSNFKIIEGNIMEKYSELEDKSINVIVTSPPYWGLRDYGEEGTTIWGGDSDCSHEWDDIKRVHPTRGNKDSKPYVDPKWESKGARTSELHSSNFCLLCNAWKGQLGQEPIFKLYIEHLVQIFEVLKTKLRDDGCLWVNLGDTYYGGGNAQGHTKDTKQFGQTTTLDTGKVHNPIARGPLNNIKDKSLVGIPDRFKIAMIDKGWICRNEIIWHKPNPMPSSASDRFTVDFEKFFFFSKKKKYYFKQQLEPTSIESMNRAKRGYSKNHKYSGAKHMNKGSPHSMVQERPNNLNRKVSETKNKRTTWSITTKGFKEAHFAVFPEELIEVSIDSCCPRYICTKCDKPEKEGTEPCGHSEFRRGVVFDPFTGSGTTGVVALKQKKSFIGTEIIPDYTKIATKRIGLHDKILLDEYF